mmetsp:Transcript_20527/g.30845  ORF Transcript_20527/g.30845 Transcript_20527/m.30845 type:complete len:93 (-) Transcript_20527:746-1024(-)
MDFMMGRIGSQSGAKILMPSENLNFSTPIQTNSDTTLCSFDDGVIKLMCSTPLYCIGHRRSVMNQRLIRRYFLDTTQNRAEFFYPSLVDMLS